MQEKTDFSFINQSWSQNTAPVIFRNTLSYTLFWTLKKSMLHVCLAVSGKELTSLDAEEIEGKSAKALKQLGLKELGVKVQVGVKGVAFILET